MDLSIEVYKNIISEREENEFLTYVILDNDQVKCGIIQNVIAKFYMFYDLDSIREERLKKRFLYYGNKWWWESNRTVPIDAFIGKDFDIFSENLSGVPKKTIKQVIGPVFSYMEQIKRVKKKRIEILPC